MKTKVSILRHIIATIINKPLPLPQYVQIEITNECNLNCKMCFRHFLDLDIKHMPIADFKRIVDKLEGVQTITPSGYGEPLMHPDIIEAIKYCKDKGFEVQITSNGLLLNTEEKVNELINSKLDSITFSLESINNNNNDFGHPNKMALLNIKKLVEYKKQLNSITPRITLQTLMVKNKENDIFDIIEWGVENGVDRINAARFELNTLPDVKRPSIEEEKKMFKVFNKYRKKYGIRIDCIQDQVYTGIKGFIYKHFKYLLHMDKHCIRLKDFMQIGVNGEIKPCCALNEYVMGNMLSDDLKTIWNSKKYNNFRKNFYKAIWCKGCDFAKLKQIERIN